MRGLPHPSFRAALYLQGTVDPSTGWAHDFSEIKTLFKPTHERLDQHYLSDIAGLKKPISEKLAHCIWQAIKPLIPALLRVRIHETCTSGCEYSSK
jgi:6-pyruvoyltetrahydropterin/6-carboxytetrahydropterin synthase